MAINMDSLLSSISSSVEMSKPFIFSRYIILSGRFVAMNRGCKDATAQKESDMAT